MNYFRFCFFADYKTQGGEFWAASRFDVERMILRVNPKATDIHVWLA